MKSLIVCFLFLTSGIQGQLNRGNCDEVRQIWKPSATCPHVIEVPDICVIFTGASVHDKGSVSWKGSNLVLTVLSCTGAINYAAYDEKQNLITSGQYTASLDLLKRQIFQENFEGDLFTNVVPYYESLRHGIWKYYDSEGYLILEEVYDRGIKRSTKTIDVNK